jgi:Flp pilus assembly protein TadG
MLTIMNQNNFRAGRSSRTATLSVEVAFCLPILLMLLFGSYELARANMILHSTESAAYEGARTGIIPGATPEKIRESARVLLRAVGINNFTVNVDPPVISETTENVSVTVLVPFRENMSFPAFFMKDPTFRGNCQLSREISR